jgi:hypothetical protein
MTAEALHRGPGWVTRAVGTVAISALLLGGCSAVGGEPSRFMEGRVADLHLSEANVGEGSHQWVGPWLCADPASPVTLHDVEIEDQDGLVIEKVGVRTVRTRGTQEFELVSSRPLSPKYQPVEGFVVDTPCTGDSKQAVEIAFQFRRQQPVAEARTIRLDYEENGDRKVHEMPGVRLTVCQRSCEVN